MHERVLAAFMFICLFTVLTAVPRDKVIVEITTGTWCQYCPGAAMGADALVGNGHQVAIIENHGGDSFATTESNARNTYYSVSGYPTAFFDGGNAYVGGSYSVSQYNNYLPRVNSRLAVASHFTISATGQETGGTFSLNITLSKVEPDTNTNLVLQAVITESGIQQNWQNQTHLNFVSRQMLPSQSGTAVSFASGSTVTVPLSFTPNPSWVLANCEIVLFLQSNTTKEILQGTKYSLSQLFGENPVSVSEIEFPDTYITESDTASFTLSNNLSSNLTGSITCDNTAFTITPSGRLDYTVPPNSSQTFYVTFTPVSSALVTATISITTNQALHPVLTIPVTAQGNYAPPKKPENMSVVMNGISTYIEWEAVTQDIINNTITTDYYLFYINSSGNPGSTYQYVGRTRFTHYTHNNAAFNPQPKFYKVIAQKLYAREGADPTDALVPGMTEAEVNAILDRWNR
jgi:hypothetical protein